LARRRIGDPHFAAGAREVDDRDDREDGRGIGRIGRKLSPGKPSSFRPSGPPNPSSSKSALSCTGRPTPVFKPAMPATSPDVIVGIDLCTTKSFIGVMEAGFLIHLADETCERLAPSVVYFPAEGEPVAGHPANWVRALEPGNTVYFLERFIWRQLRGDSGV